MRIRVQRAGGFAGITEDLGVIATDMLPPSDATRVQEAIAELAARDQGSAEVGADFYQYRIRVLTDGGEQVFEVSDPGDPGNPGNPALGELLRLLSG